MDILKLKDWEDIPENYTGIIECSNGSIFYFLNGFIHREDGPAVTHPNGNMHYYLNGKLHREDGPAIIHPSGKIYYFLKYIDITKKVNIWIKENKIPKVWSNSDKILFKLTFG